MAIRALSVIKEILRLPGIKNGLHSGIKIINKK